MIFECFYKEIKLLLITIIYKSECNEREWEILPVNEIYFGVSDKLAILR